MLNKATPFLETYVSLVMVEKKCVEIDQQQATTTNKLTDEQWQALIALHRTLLHEHHDFFLASQHPSSSPALKRLATKYAMPARMWRPGIHSFLELLRHRLPVSLDHMLSFVYLAYSMMALHMKSVPSFEETWIECLGDLARYRMAIEEAVPSLEETRIEYLGDLARHRMVINEADLKDGEVHEKAAGSRRRPADAAPSPLGSTLLTSTMTTPNSRMSGEAVITLMVHSLRPPSQLLLGKPKFLLVT